LQVHNAKIGVFDVQDRALNNNIVKPKNPAKAGFLILIPLSGI